MTERMIRYLIGLFQKTESGLFCCIIQYISPREFNRNSASLTQVLGVSSKGPYAMSRTPITQMAMSNDWLAAQGLVSIKDQWVRFHYPASTA